MQNFTQIVAVLLRKLPIKYQNTIYEIVLKYIPIWLLKLIPCSYSTYLKCYYPKKGDVILDCGAHVGNCTIIFSRIVGKTGLVISLEPIEDSFTILNERLKRLKLVNVLTFNKGVWDQKIKLPVTINSNTSYGRIILDKKSEYSENEIKITCTTIDDLVKDLKLSHLDLIKMDIEGAEIEALKGAANTLETLSPNLAIASYHRRDKTQTFGAIEKYLNEKKYSVKTFFPPHLTTCAEPYSDN